MIIRSKIIERADIVHSVVMNEDIVGVWPVIEAMPYTRNNVNNRYVVHLRSEGLVDAEGNKRRYPRGGNDGSGVRGCTYNEWGYFIAELFRIDPEATIGPYKGVDHFHELTRYQF
jgi:hypothetical protein